MSNENDKREILKYKQGLLLEEEENTTYYQPQYEKPKGKAAWANYWYHYKGLTIAGVIVLAIVAILIYDAVTKLDDDLMVLGVTNTAEASLELALSSEEIGQYFSVFCEDFDQNGYSHVTLSTVDLFEGEYTDPNSVMASQVKLTSELSLGTTQIYIGNREALLKMLFESTPEEMFEDLSQRYPDCTSIVDKYYYQIKGSTFAEYVGWDSCPEDMYIAMRGEESLNGESKKVIDAREKACSFMDNFVNMEIINPIEPKETEELVD